MSRSKEEFGIAVGDTYWKIFEINKTHSGTYLIPSFTKIGLHLSIHPPNHVHIRDRKIGIDEDVEIDRRFWSKENWVSILPNFVDIFQRGVNPNLNDEQVVFLSPSTFRGLAKRLHASKHIFDIGEFLSCRLYVGEARKIPSLIRKLESIYPKSQVYGSTCGFTNSGRIFIPIGSQTIYEICFPAILQALDLAEFQKALYDALTRTANFLRERAANCDVPNLAELERFVKKLEHQPRSFDIQIESF